MPVSQLKETCGFKIADDSILCTENESSAENYLLQIKIRSSNIVGKEITSTSVTTVPSERMA